jgi:hypothetical protein
MIWIPVEAETMSVPETAETSLLGHFSVPEDPRDEMGARTAGSTW